MRKLILATAIVALAACNANPPPSADATAPATNDGSAAPATPAPAPADTTPPSTPMHAASEFSDKVWRADAATGVEAGTTYAFLGDGTLVVDSPNGTPMTGSWTYVDGQLAMVEEGIAYPTDIVSLDAGHLLLRSHNPGGTVDIALSAAPDAPLPPGT